MIELEKYRNEDGTYTSPKNGKTYRSLKAFRSHWYYTGHVNGTEFKKRLYDVACQYCDKEFSCATVKRHEKTCIKNPKNYKECPVCGNQITSRKNVTCSYSCSNTLFRHGHEGGTQYKTDEQLEESNRYRDICFRYHEAKCVVCSESNIVEVHHLNENSTDHRPENLVPLCPTHHQYWHSRHRYLIEEKVYKYMKEKFGV